LSAIQDEINNEGIAKPTKIHHVCNVSYDKLLRYLNELDKSGMIVKTDASLSLTNRGNEFLQRYYNMKSINQKLGLR